MTTITFIQFFIVGVVLIGLVRSFIKGWQKTVAERKVAEAQALRQEIHRVRS